MEESSKKMLLPVLVLIIGVVIGLLVAGFGVYKQIAAKKENQKRYDEAYKLVLENKAKLEKRYAEIEPELKSLNDELKETEQECDFMDMLDPSWAQCKSDSQDKTFEINTKISKLKSEQFQIENYDNTVYYQTVKPMTYQVFYIIGGSIAGAAALGAFIIYLVKGKRIIKSK